MVPRLQPALVAARDVPAATACAATALTASEQVFGIALVSDFFMLVTGIAGSCFYCKWERRSRSTMRCTLWLPCALCNALYCGSHVPSAMHFAPRLVASAATVPFDARGGPLAPRTRRLLARRMC